MKVEDVYCLPVSQAVRHKSMLNAIRKYRYTYTKLMYERTPIELLDNLYMGDLAKNALIEYLQLQTNQLVIDYDDVRRDNFMESDPGWDFAFGKKLLKTEVKSSIPPKGEYVKDIIEKRDIKITASHDNGKTWIFPNDLESDIHVQIYFYAHVQKSGNKNFDELYAQIKDSPQRAHELIQSSKYDNPLFLGWNTKKQLIRFEKELKPNNWTFSWTNRIYWRCPIKQAYNLRQLVELLK